MLKILLGIAIMAIPTFAQQWQYVAQDYHECATNGVAVVMVGDNGYILHSADTANSWSLPNSTTYNNLLCTEFIGDATVIIGGTNGLLLRSDDAGSTWSQLPYNAHADVTSLVTVGPATLYAFTSDMGIHKSVDKGISWNNVGFTPDTVRDAAFAYPSAGVIVTTIGELYRTEDSEKTWGRVFSDTAKGLAGIEWVGRVYVACGKSGALFSAIETADSWVPYPDVPKTIDGLEFMSSSRNVIIVGRSNSGDGRNAIAYSTNGALTWNFPNEQLHNYRFDELRDVIFLANETILICGNNGKIITGNVDNSDWRFITCTYLDPQQWGKTTLNNGGDFAAQDTGLIVANQFSRGAWLHTTNRGVTWIYNDGISLDELINPKFFPYFKKYTAIGNTYGDIYQSLDYGKSWTGFYSNRVPSKPVATTDISWADENSAALVHDSLAFTTTDGGKNWKGTTLPLQKVGYLNKVNFISKNIGFAAGMEAEDIIKGPYRTVLFRTSNNGELWQPVYQRHPAAQITTIACRDEQHIFFGYPKVWENGRTSPDSGYIFRSSDGGDSWDSVVVLGGVPTEIKFYSPSNGIATGSNGMLFRTSDGGETWSGERVPDIDMPKRPYWYGHVLSRDGKTLFLLGAGTIAIRRDLLI